MITINDFEIPSHYTIDGTDIWEMVSCTDSPTCTLRNIRTDEKISFAVGSLLAKKYLRIDYTENKEKAGINFMSTIIECTRCKLKTLKKDWQFEKSHIFGHLVTLYKCPACHFIQGKYEIEEKKEKIEADYICPNCHRRKIKSELFVEIEKRLIKYYEICQQEHMSLNSHDKICRPPTAITEMGMVITNLAESVLNKHCILTINR